MSTLPQDQTTTRTQQRITINGVLDVNAIKNTPHSHHKNLSTSSKRNDVALMTLHPQTQALAAEWLDGLLILLGQEPITSETKRLLNAVGGWGLKIRLLNVNFDNSEEIGDERGAMPTREGLDEDYYYDVFGGA
jgi:engulfment/cell motility protein 1